MVEGLAAAFLLAHGMVHLAIWMIPPASGKPPPFVPGESWALNLVAAQGRTVHAASVVLAVTSACLLATAGMGVLSGVHSWPATAVAGAVVAAAFKLVWFHPQITMGVVLDAAVVAAVLAGWPPSLF